MIAFLAPGAAWFNENITIIVIALQSFDTDRPVFTHETTVSHSISTENSGQFSSKPSVAIGFPQKIQNPKKGCDNPLAALEANPS